MPDVFGLEVPDLAPGQTPVEVLVVVKAFDATGTVLATRYSPGLTAWEAVGMAIVAADSCRDTVRRGLHDHDEDDD